MNKKPEEKSTRSGFALAKENYVYLIIGFVIIIIGFLLMVGGKSPDPNTFNEKEIFNARRITIAPLVLLIGFAFEIFAIMRKPRTSDKA